MAPDRLAEDYIALTAPGAEAESDFTDPWAISALSRLLTPTQTSRGDAERVGSPVQLGTEPGRLFTCPSCLTRRAATVIVMLILWLAP